MTDLRPMSPLANIAACPREELVALLRKSLTALETVVHTQPGSGWRWGLMATLRAAIAQEALYEPDVLLLQGARINRVEKRLGCAVLGFGSQVVYLDAEAIEKALFAMGWVLKEQKGEAE